MYLHWHVAVCAYVVSDLSFNNISTISKRWLYGLNSLQRLYVMLLSHAQNPLHTFPRDCQLVADLLATRPTSPQQVGNKSMWWNLENDTTLQTQPALCGILYKRLRHTLTYLLTYLHNGLLPAPSCYGLGTWKL